MTQKSEKKLVDGFLKGLGETLKNTDDQARALYYSIKSLQKEGKYSEAAAMVNAAMTLVGNKIGREAREKDEKLLSKLRKEAKKLK